MKKALKIVRKIFIGVVGFLFFASLSIFIYHHYQLGKESKLIKDKGTLVSFNGRNINVYNEGSGKDTYVFMPGAGVAAPIYEMKGLYRKFSKDNRIAVVERAGYGYSDVFDDKRDIDTILKQTRQALIQSGNKGPYILVPHSLSGLEAIYWAQKYPDEVKGIIALDIGLPQEYAAYKMGLTDSLTVRAINLLTKIGVQRLVPSAVYDPEVIKQSFLTEQEKKAFKALSYKQIFNEIWSGKFCRAVRMQKNQLIFPCQKKYRFYFYRRTWMKIRIQSLQSKKIKTTRNSQKNYLYQK